MEYGPYTRAQLLEHGIDARQLTKMLKSTEAHRVHRGWYAYGKTPREAVRAVKLRGRLGCLSACAVHQLWVPPSHDLHVMLNPGARRHLSPVHGVLFHPLTRPCHTAVASLTDSIDQVLQHHDAETGLIVAESAVNLGLVDEYEARHLVAHGRGRRAILGQRFSPLAQSGSETRLRLFFQQNRVPVTPQAHIAGIGRVDLLVGRSWIIEADSVAHHSARLAMNIDRERDLHARELGYVCDRFSFDQIWGSWERTQRFLLSALRSRRHLRVPTPLSG